MEVMLVFWYRQFNSADKVTWCYMSSYPGQRKPETLGARTRMDLWSSSLTLPPKLYCACIRLRKSEMSLTIEQDLPIIQARPICQLCPRLGTARHQIMVGWEQIRLKYLEGEALKSLRTLCDHSMTPDKLFSIRPLSFTWILSLRVCVCIAFFEVFSFVFNCRNICLSFAQISQLVSHCKIIMLTYKTNTN